jgi:hypothetical protein
MRYFRTDDADLYESIRLQLDAAWGHPSEDGRTVTCIDPVAVAPRDLSDRVLLAVREEFVTYEPAASILPQLLTNGAVEEISEADFAASVARPEP